MGRRLAVRIGSVIGVGCVGLALCVSALAAGTSLHLSGPTSNKIGTSFTYKISGFFARPYDAVVTFQALATSGCASTEQDELVRWHEGKTAHPYSYIYAESNRPFSFHVHFKAKVPGKHDFCVYVVENKPEAPTGAHARAQWTNHH
jgi:hypothetical protein